MEIIVRDVNNEIVEKGNYCFMEEKSRQEGKLSFFIDYGRTIIEFFPENIEDMNKIIQDLKEIRDSMQKKVDNKEM